MQRVCFAHKQNRVCPTGTGGLPRQWSDPPEIGRVVIIKDLRSKRKENSVNPFIHAASGDPTSFPS